MGQRKKRPGGRHVGRSGSGRVTPRGTRPEERRDLPIAADADTDFRLDLLMDNASYVVERHRDLSDLDELDRWASAIQFEVRSPASPGGIRAAVVLSRAASAGGPAGAALAAAMAAYGPVPERDRARGIVERFAADSGDAPEWLTVLGAVEPVRAVRLTDEWGEYGGLDIDFRRRGGATHCVRIGIHPFQAGMAHPIIYFAAADEATRARPASFRAEEIGLADARAIAEPRLEILEGVLADHHDDTDTDLDPSHDLFALARQRISLLPAGGAAAARPQPSLEDMAAPFGEFAAKPPGYGEHDDSVYHLMRSLMGFVVGCWDSDPLHWTPPRIAAFVEEWLPDHGYYCHDCRELHEPPSYEEWLPTFRSGFLRWLRLTAKLGQLPDDTRDANLAAAKASLKKLTRRVGGQPT